MRGKIEELFKRAFNVEKIHISLDISNKPFGFASLGKIFDTSVPDPSQIRQGSYKD